MFEIHTDFEGANCKILSVNGGNVCLDVELRDTVGDWFFWCFKVVNAGGKTLTFTFPNRCRVGYYGAAVSHDYQTWKWQYDAPEYAGNAFTYAFAEGENEVYFAHDMLYRPARFFAVADKLRLPVKALCLSERGREVPYVEFGRGEETILLTARHHACEATGNYLLEGVLEEMIRSELVEKFRIVCVPFVDYDGVVDGDQGKNRNGKDHNRDYELGQPSTYASIRAIRNVVENCRLRFAFDFHSPWHLGGGNDTLFLPIKNGDTLSNIQRFSKLFEEQTTGAGTLPHYEKDDVKPNAAAWNVADAPCFGTYMASRGAELAFALETPYFQATGVRFTPEKGIETGRKFVQTIEKYLQNDDGK